MRRLLIVCVLAACGQAASSDGAFSAGSGGSTSMPSDGTPCGQIGAVYHDAFLEAVACDPSAPDACTEWRPLSVATVGNGGSTADARITGLCFTAGVGYVTPQHAPQLDALIDRYKEAGCKVGFCPGPPTVANRCARNAAGRFTCGGM